MSDKYEVFSMLALAQYEGLKHLGLYDETHIKAAITLHKDGYYCCPDVHSGLMSETALENALAGKSSLNAEDHFHSRTKSSREFHKHYDAGRFRIDRPSRMATWYKSRCRVNTVTRDENTRLIPVQNDITTKDQHYTLQYRAIGINKLVPKPDLRNKFIFVVEGQAYQTAKDVADTFKIAVATVHARCKNERFTEWQKIPKKSP